MYLQRRIKNDKAKCVSCHGADGKGQRAACKAIKARELDAVKGEFDDDWTFVIVADKNTMPAEGKRLTDAAVTIVKGKADLPGAGDRLRSFEKQEKPSTLI